jgi:hypothetical protein
MEPSSLFSENTFTNGDTIQQQNGNPNGGSDKSDISRGDDKSKVRLSVLFIHIHM